MNKLGEERPAAGECGAHITFPPFGAASFSAAENRKSTTGLLGARWSAAQVANTTHNYY
jgi:hypothetical protein